MSEVSESEPLPDVDNVIDNIGVDMPF